MFKIIATLLLASQTLFAGLPPTTLKGQSETSKVTTFNFQVPNNQATTTGGGTRLIETGNPNILSNSSFENSSASTGWTVTVGSAAADTSNRVDGAQSLAVTYSAASGDLLSQCVTPAAALAGLNVTASMFIKNADSNMSLCQLNGSTEVQCQALNTSTDWQFAQVTFPAPTSGSICLKIKTSSSTTKTVNYDAAQIQALKSPVVSVSSITNEQSYTPTYTGFGTVSTSEAYWLQVGPYIYMRGRFVAGTSTGVEARLSLPNNFVAVSTITTLQTSGIFLSSTSATQHGGSTLIEPSVSYITFSDKATFSGTSVSSLAKAVGTSVASTGETISWHAMIPIQGFSASQNAAAANQGDWDWKDETCTGSWSTNTTYACKSRKVGSDVYIKEKVTLSGAPTSAALTLTLPNSWVIDTTRIPGTVSVNSPVGSQPGTILDSGTNKFPAIVLYNSTTSVAVWYHTSATAIPLATVTQAAPMTFATGDAVEVEYKVPIVGFYDNQRAPALIGSITSNSVNTDAVCSATITSNGSSAVVASSDGNCLSKTSDNTTGDSTYAFVAGLFSATPRCYCTPYTGGGQCMIDNTTAISSTVVRIQTNNAAGTGTNMDVFLWCKGPR